LSLAEGRRWRSKAAIKTLRGGWLRDGQPLDLNFQDH